LDAVQFLSDGRVRALCGAPLGKLSTLAAREGYSGLGFAAGIPGTLGGAVLMNAGTGVGSMSDVVESVEILFPDAREIKTLFNNELNYSYRNCRLQGKNAVILSAALKLKSGFDPDALLGEIRALNLARKLSQPLDLPSAGSVFKRPSPDIAISKIIDELGFKGRRIGGAEVSKKHAGFIVNLGGATSKDVRALIEEIQNTVEREKGFRPISEIRFIPES
jgi:UDP-N-acetylmuramate dehydrogenase